MSEQAELQNGEIVKIGKRYFKLKVICTCKDCLADGNPYMHFSSCLKDGKADEHSSELVLSKRQFETFGVERIQDTGVVQ